MGPSPPRAPAADSALAPALTRIRSSLATGERLRSNPYLSENCQAETLSFRLDTPWGEVAETSLLPPPSVQDSFQVRA